MPPEDDPRMDEQPTREEWEAAMDKPAATGSGEPKCPKCGGEKNNPCFLWTQTTGWGDVECGPKCANIFHNAPTPPASQSTVTLDRETFDEIVALLEKLGHSQRVSTGMTTITHGLGARAIALDVLALLRAAEQKS